MSDFDLARLHQDFGERLIFREEIGSTNDEALALGRRGADSGLVVLAGHQTAGRGRRGSAWFSGKTRGLAFSVLYRPEIERELWARLALVAGVAVARVVEQRGLIAEIKWPNDVLISGKKVCGILVEAEESVVVLGIGINVGQVTLPAEVESQATSLEEESGTAIAREEVLLAAVLELDKLVGLARQDFGEVIRMVRERCALSDKAIRFTDGSGMREARCRGVGDGGELLVETPQGVERVIAAEEIRVCGS